MSFKKIYQGRSNTLFCILHATMRKIAQMRPVRRQFKRPTNFEKLAHIEYSLTNWASFFLSVSVFKNGDQGLFQGLRRNIANVLAKLRES